MSNFFLTWGLVIIAALMDVAGILVIKLRLNALGPIKFESIYHTLVYCLKIISTPLTFLAAIVIVLSPVIYAFALSRMHLSIAYPLIIGFSAIFLLILSYVILNETITFNNILGMLLILSGIFLIYIKWKKLKLA